MITPFSDHVDHIISLFRAHDPLRYTIPVSLIMNKRTDYYINRASTTLLAVMALIRGVAAGYFVYRIIVLIVPAIESLRETRIDIAYILDTFFPEANINPDASISGMIISYYVLAGVLFLIMAGLILDVIEAISLLLLRAARAGASGVKTVHIIHLIFVCIHIVLFGYTIVTYFIENSGQRLISMGVFIAFIIPAAIYLVVLILRLCFHKDIIRAMSTVKYECSTGKHGRLIKTHLSGISFIFGFFYALITAIAIFTELQGKATTLSAAAVIVSLLVITTEYFCICACNRNLKLARQIPIEDRFSDA